MVKVTNSDMELLKKAGIALNASDFKGAELRRLAELLDMDELFNLFPEKFLRGYRDHFSGQPIQGVQVNRVNSGEATSFSFIPFAEATRVQLYDGLIFSIINPAARNLARIMLWLNTSDYARMSISDAAGWGALSNTLTKVKGWSRYLDIVRNPGAVIAPMLTQADTSNLLALDAMIYSKLPPSLHMDSLDRLYIDNLDLV